MANIRRVFGTFWVCRQLAFCSGSMRRLPITGSLVQKTPVFPEREALINDERSAYDHNDKDGPVPSGIEDAQVHYEAGAP